MRPTRLLPILGAPPGYSRGGLGADLVAGATTAAVVIPKSLAFAAIAGLPVEAGLYTALPALAVYAVLGSSRVLSVSTTTTLAILTAADLGRIVPTGDPAVLAAGAATLALLVGAALVVASLARLGFVASFISESVLSGFKAGIGLVILAAQLPKLLGLHGVHGGFFAGLAATVTHLGDTSIPTLILAVASLGLLFGLQRFAPRIPAPLIAVACGVAASAAIGLHAMGVATVGAIPPGLPPLAWPDLSLAGELWPGALGIALMSFVESIAAGRAFAATGETRPTPNRELLALGVANVAAALLRGMAAGGGTSQTAVNRQSGARTQVSSLAAAALVLATVLFLAPLIRLMPQATLAAVVVATSLGLVAPADLQAIARVRLDEFWWAVAAVVGVLVFGTLNGILLAVIFSLAVLLFEANHPRVYAMARDSGTGAFRPLAGGAAGGEALPGLLILRTEGRIFFGNAQRIHDKMAPMVDAARPEVLLLDLGAVPDIEFTALKMLSEAEAALARAGVALWLASLNPGVERILSRAPLGRSLGPDRMFADLNQAVGAFRRRQAEDPSTLSKEELIP